MANFDSLILYGSGMNQLSRCVTAPDAYVLLPGGGTSSGGDSVNGNVEALRDGNVYEPFIHQNIVGTKILMFDMNQVENGGFETTFNSSGLPGNGWGKNSLATVARVTGAAYEGSGACRISGNGGELYYDLEASAGEMLNFQVAVKVNSYIGFQGLVGIIVQNLETGKYLDPAGAWTSSFTWYKGISGTTFHTPGEGGLGRAVLKPEAKGLSLSIILVYFQNLCLLS